MNFDQMGLCTPILRAVREAGYTTPTPIQAQAITPALAGRDLLGCAQTGTGKTAAFSLPLLQRVDRSAGDEPRIRALVVTPTRELAAQIGESVATYGKHLEDLWHTVIFGGVNEKQQIRELQKGVDILVATPGRLLDLLQRDFLSLRHVEVFVLDEADRMLDMGFMPRGAEASSSPRSREKRQSLAVLGDDARRTSVKLAESSILDDPVSVVEVTASGDDRRDRIDQSVIYFVEKKQKRRPARRRA